MLFFGGGGGGSEFPPLVRFDRKFMVCVVGLLNSACMHDLTKHKFSYTQDLKCSAVFLLVSSADISPPWIHSSLLP